VLASSVPRDAVDNAVAAAGKQARRSDGKLPPHFVVYLVMALALFADDDYEEVAARLTETLIAWGCWDDSWSLPTSGGITQARQRLGAHEEALRRGGGPGRRTADPEGISRALAAVRVIEYEVPDRDGDGKGEVIALVATIAEMTAAPAPLLAEVYHQRWEHATGKPSSRPACAAPGGCCGPRAGICPRQGYG
jgi:hypothetical protein